jgi:hypothetical protein
VSQHVVSAPGEIVPAPIDSVIKSEVTKMRKRILLVISVLLILGMAIAAVAYQRATLTNKAAMECCCCSGDSCPMKAKGGTTGEKSESCCGENCCCKNGNAESCPMKKVQEGTAAGSQPMGEKTEGCCSCCKKDKQ